MSKVLVKIGTSSIQAYSISHAIMRYIPQGREVDMFNLFILLYGQTN